MIADLKRMEKASWRWIEVSDEPKWVEVIVGVAVAAMTLMCILYSAAHMADGSSTPPAVMMPVEIGGLCVGR